MRKLGLGSSDAAVAVSLSPYKCPLTLWLKKSGHKEAVLWGIELEPVLAQVYAKRTGYRVRRVNAVLQHPEHPFMLANLDREVVGHPEGPGILEIKTASYHSAPLWEEGVPVTISFHRDGISLPVCQSLLSLLGREAERTDLDLGRCTQLTLNFRNPGSPPVELASALQGHPHLRVH